MIQLCLLCVFITKIYLTVTRERSSLTVSNDINLLVVVRVPQQLPDPRAGAGPGEGRGGRHGGVRHLEAQRGGQAIER